MFLRFGDQTCAACHDAQIRAREIGAQMYALDRERSQLELELARLREEGQCRRWLTLAERRQSLSAEYTNLERELARLTSELQALHA